MSDDMPLICPSCAYVPDPDEAFCSRCGTDFCDLSDSDALIPAVVDSLVPEQWRTSCAAFGRVATYDPVTEEMGTRFSCGRWSGRIDCVACPVCALCSDLPCSCGCVSINIDVKLKPTIETVSSRRRLE